MAGESPGKSEQRKSSGEVTSTSTSSRDAQEQDPRFAVFRESAATAAAGEADGTATDDAPPRPNGSRNAAADGATAAFTPRGDSGALEAPEAAEAPVTASEGSPQPEPPERNATRELESTTERESDPTFAPAKRGNEDAPAEPESATGADSGTATGTSPKPGGAPESPDAGRKTASNDAPAKPGAEETLAEPEPRADSRTAADAPGSESATDSPNADVDGTAPAQPDAAHTPDEPGVDQKTAVFTALKPGAVSGPAVEPEARTDSRTVSDAGRETAGRGADEAASVPTQPDTAPRPGDDAGLVEPAAVSEAASVPAAEPDARAAAGAAPKAGGTTESRDAGEAASVPAQPDAAPSPEGAGVDRETAVFTALKPEVGSGPGVEPEARADSRTAADSAPKSDDRPESGSTTHTSDVGQETGEAASASGRTPDEPGVDRKTAVFKALKSGPSDARTAADAPSSEAGSAGSAEPDASGTSPDGEPGVDRKTAVFRALKTDSAPAKPDGESPGVDQPTAMLKLPPQPPAAAPELPAERTSKFVPLRREDVSAPAQPGAQPVVDAERTRQQPMPPLPPLDLLAELTNKPAPPETPTRTVVRRVKIWTPLLVLVLIVFAVVQAVRPLPTPSLDLTANSSYTFEGDKPSLPWPGEGQGFMAATGLGTVGSFGEQKAVPIGSVAKAMTAYVVLKDKPLKKGEQGPNITVDAKAEADGGLDAQGESTLNTVKEGDKLTQHDALAALMIPSANNIARLLARWDSGGSEEEFVKKMNDTAAELGMENTKYTDPSGLDATTVSSAEDQVKLGQKLVEIEALMDITKLPEWTDPSGKTWRNYNTLVPYDGALGIKTGSTTKAGGNLLFAAHKMVGDTDQLIVGAILGQHQAPIIDTVNAASKEVMLATQDELDGATIVKKGQVVGTVDNGLGTTVPLVAVEDVKAVGWSGLTVKLELADGGKAVPLSAAAGTHVGTLTVGEGKSQVEVAVALQSDLAEASFLDKLTRVG